MPDLREYDLSIDLRDGMVPISKAAAALAAIIKRARTERRPVVITQKGFPSGVIVDIDLFNALKDLARAEEELVLRPSSSDGS
jgi:prevent-host-death family protein